MLCTLKVILAKQFRRESGDLIPAALYIGPDQGFSLGDTILCSD